MAKTARRNTRVVIFGAGLGGARVWMALSPLPAIDVVSFVDNDPRKHGTTLYDTPVCGLDGLSSLDYDYVLVASIHHAAIRTQLVKSGVPGRRILVLGPAHDVRAQLRARRIDVGTRVRLPDAPVLRAAICGAGSAGLHAWESLTAYAGVEIVAFLDNDRQRWGTSFLGVPVASADDLDPATVDFVLVASVHSAAIVRQLLELGIPTKQIATPTMLEWLVMRAES